MLMGTWVGGFLHTVIPVSLEVQLPFCGPNKIDHHFCDVHPVLKLACTDKHIIGGVVMANSGTITLGNFVILLVSYTVILVSLRKQSAEGSAKLSPPVGPTLPWSSSFLILVLSHTRALTLTLLRIRWWLYFTLLLCPC
jgi:hypothetical protein